MNAIIAIILLVTSFVEKPDDKLASMRPVKDSNGSNCALIRVFSDVNDLEFSSQHIIRSGHYSLNEYRVYISSGAESITISSPGSKQINYRFPVRLKAETTYHMKVGSSQGESSTYTESKDTDQAQSSSNVSFGSGNTQRDGSIAVLNEINYSDLDPEKIVIQAKKQLDSGMSKTFYNLLFRGAATGLNVGRILSAPYRYVFMNSLDFCYILLKNAGTPKAFADIGKKIVEDTTFTIFKAMINHPEKLSMTIAHESFKDGLNSYDYAYDLYKKYKKEGFLGVKDSYDFIYHDFNKDKMGHAKVLVNRVNNHKYPGRDYSENEILGLMGKIKITDFDSELEIAEEYKKGALLFLNYANALKESRVGIMAYEPYLEFLQNMADINENYNSVLRNCLRGGEEDSDEGQITQILNEIKHPVLFIHGLGSSSEAWDNLKGEFDSQNKKFGGNYVNSSSKLRSGDFYTINIENTENTTFDILGTRVSAAVRAIRRATGSEKVVLVGHSLGGLAARAYLNTNPGDVSALITIGTPHGGSFLGFAKDRLIYNSIKNYLFPWGANSDLVFAAGCIINRDVVFGSTVDILKPDSRELARLNSFEPPKEVIYVSIVCNANHSRLNHRGIVDRLTQAFAKRYNNTMTDEYSDHNVSLCSPPVLQNWTDFVVPACSQHLFSLFPSSNFKHKEYTIEGLFHNHQPSSSKGINTIIEALNYVNENIENGNDQNKLAEKYTFWGYEKVIKTKIPIGDLVWNGEIWMALTELGWCYAGLIDDEMVLSSIPINEKLSVSILYDFDNDGVKDLVGCKDGKIYVYNLRGNEYKVITESQIDPDLVSTKQHELHFVCGDFNGDGKTNIAYTWSRGLERTIEKTGGVKILSLDRTNKLNLISETSGIVDRSFYTSYNTLVTKVFKNTRLFVTSNDNGYNWMFEYKNNKLELVKTFEHIGDGATFGYLMNFGHQIYLINGGNGGSIYIDEIKQDITLERKYSRDLGRLSYRILKPKTLDKTEYIAVAHSYTDQYNDRMVSVIKKNQNGFDVVWNTKTKFTYDHIFASDLDNDGEDDLIVMSMGENSSECELRVLSRNPDFVFSKTFSSIQQDFIKESKVAILVTDKQNVNIVDKEFSQMMKFGGNIYIIEVADIFSGEIKLTEFSTICSFAYGDEKSVNSFDKRIAEKLAEAIKNGAVFITNGEAGGAKLLKEMGLVEAGTRSGWYPALPDSRIFTYVNEEYGLFNDVLTEKTPPSSKSVDYWYSQDHNSLAFRVDNSKNYTNRYGIDKYKIQPDKYLAKGFSTGFQTGSISDQVPIWSAGLGSVIIINNLGWTFNQQNKSGGYIGKAGRKILENIGAGRIR